MGGGVLCCRVGKQGRGWVLVVGCAVGGGGGGG